MKQLSPYYFMLTVDVINKWTANTKSYGVLTTAMSHTEKVNVVTKRKIVFKTTTPHDAHGLIRVL